jgi:hypothetical protein
MGRSGTVSEGWGNNRTRRSKLKLKEYGMTDICENGRINDNIKMN